MSLLNFPPEITFQIVQKLNLFNRINLSRVHARIMPLCFDRLLDRKSKRTITINELQLLHQQSRTENEREQCFNPSVLDRIRAKNFNEVVHMHMKPENNQFFANQKILHSFKGNIVIASENEKFSEDFYEKLLFFIDRVEGDILLVFENVSIEHFGHIFAKKCADIISRKMESGKKVFCIQLRKDFTPFRSLGCEIRRFMGSNPCTIYYLNYHFPHSENEKYHWLRLRKKNSGANIKVLIAMINQDRFTAEKQHLMQLIPLVKAAESQDLNRVVQCDNCFASALSTDNQIMLWLEEPAWFNCAGCVVNIK